MYYVYLLQSVKYRKIYIGFTEVGIKRRLCQHNAGYTTSTKYFRPWQRIYFEAYCNKRDAQIREYRLKYHGKALGQLKRRLANSLS